jgi:pyruvate kinase
VIAIVAGTRTKSGSTNFLRLHVMGEHNLEGMRFFTTHEEDQAAAPGTSKVKRVPAKADKAPMKPK